MRIRGFKNVVKCSQWNSDFITCLFSQHCVCLCVFVCSCVTSWLLWSCSTLQCCWENTGWDPTSTTSALSCCISTEKTASSCCWVRDTGSQKRERETKYWLAFVENRKQHGGGRHEWTAFTCQCTSFKWIWMSLRRPLYVHECEKDSQSVEQTLLENYENYWELFVIFLI